MGTSPRKSAKPTTEASGIVEVVSDAGDELPDGGHLFRLDELVLQTPPLRLIIEEQHEGGSVGAANRHRGNRIGLLAGPELHLAARSLLIQGPLQIGDPLRRSERLPGPADQTRRRGIHQIGKRAVGTANPAAPIHDAQGRRDRIDHLLPGPAPVVVKVHEPGALERDARLGHQPFEQPQGRRAEAAGLASNGHGARHPAPGDERRQKPGPAAVGLGCEVALGRERLEPVGHHERPESLDELEQGSAVGSAGRPGVHEVLRVGVPVEQREGDLGGREALPDVAQQQIDDRRAPERPGQLLTERGDPAE